MKIERTISTAVSIEPYINKNPYVYKLKQYLNKNLKSALVGAYVHGSIGNYEEINYSDFDALVILKDIPAEDTLYGKKILRKLKYASRFFFQFDSLQHHGWFVLYESDLHNYPQTYFPHELFEYTKSLFEDQGRTIEIRIPTEGIDYQKPFLELSNAIIKQLITTTPQHNNTMTLERNSHPRIHSFTHSLITAPKNVYQLKSLLSKFMLLPALYVQARDQRGIFKKHSFEAARKDFLAQEWEIIDEVSYIRKIWHYEISWIKKAIMSRPGKLSRKFAKHFAPKVPADINNKLSPDFYQSILSLTFLMQKKIPTTKN